MKIAMVSEHASPLARPGGVDGGGQCVYVAALSRELGRMGHEVAVYSRRDDENAPEQQEYAPGVTIHNVPVGPASSMPRDELLPLMPDFGRWLAQRWATDPPEVIHSHFWMSGVAALLGGRDLGVPLVHTFHSLGAVQRRHQSRRDSGLAGRIRIERALLRDAAGVVALCSEEAEELVRMGARRDHLRVIPAGVDVESFHPEGPSEPRNGRHRILAVGRLVERKGYETAIAALRRVPATELLIAGGPASTELDRDVEYRRLSKIAARHGVLDRVEFLGGVDHASVPALIRSADAVVCVAWYEPFGLVPLEAMGCGVSVVASAVGGYLDTIVDGSTGVHVPPRRPDRLAATLRELLEDPFRRDGYGIAGLDRVRSRYTWERIAGDLLGVYHEVLDRPQSDLVDAQP